MAHAQQGARVATRVDSLRAARDGKPTYFPAVFTFVSGKQARGYVRDYRSNTTNQVRCYEQPPDVMPMPPVKVISIERLQSMTVDGHTLESLHMRGKPLKRLAENLATPGPMEIYGYSVSNSNGTHEKYYWYVRKAGGELQEVPRGHKAFVEFMSKQCSKAPALAAELQQSAKAGGATKSRYRIDNAPELVSQYNALVAGK
ncbi:hypothetical protein [Hymenobacter arizonensis]|uniref:Uncharacterized protein n=1 Tax=Hymenobacter arizonensis TaxID=1227077 RepID=A0A1I5X4Z7_HYMAR|nr:hypothetical protein [Hymenobacter arizonensis]SFQ26896.1 hypothetical protein SAMN04515668_1643 [Hymenobacter arizonensis]